jgi:hypothetical protein
VTKPQSNGISIDARGTDEVVNLDNIVLLPKLAKRARVNKPRGLEIEKFWQQRSDKNEISRQLVFVSKIFFCWTT